MNASAFSAGATTMPAVAMLVDLLGFHRLTTVTTTTAQNTVNTNTFTASSSSGLLLTFANDWQNYQKVRFTNVGGALPTGLVAGTDYWLVRVSATTARVATSFANAIAGTVIAFTDAGTGTHTLTARLNRYTDGAGVQAFMWNTNATALGAGTPNLSLGYTNSAGTQSRATPTVLPIGKTAAPNGLILYSGTSTSYVSGEYSVGLCRPLLSLPMTTLGVAAERDLMNQLPSLPKVYDGAVLIWLLYNGAATPVNSPFYGHLDLGWS